MTRSSILLMTLVLATLTATADAARVVLETPSGTVYVGVPFPISITIHDANEYDVPRLTDVPGLTRKSGRPSESSNFAFVNGRTSSSKKLTWTYTADRTGSITIPPVAMVVDGQRMETRPATIRVREIEQLEGSEELLFVEVEADRDTYYLGQPIELTLRIWLRPYRTGRIDFDAGTMYDLIRPGTELGVFSPVSNRFGYRELPRADAEGNRHTYYVYTVTRTFTPRQAGRLSFDDIRIVVQYPTSVRRSRGLLRRWEIVSSNTLAASPQRAPLTILSPPTEGRPVSFAGAVGSFDLFVTARPVDVAVGDPITLTMTVQDRSRPQVEIEHVQPPRLESNTQLMRDFRIAGDPPAGEVQGRHKTFTQTIRAKTDKVIEVPPVAYTFFDPDSATYITATSPAIPLKVRPTTTLADSDIVDAGTTMATQSVTELTEVEGGLLANYSGADLLLGSQTFRIGVGHAVVALLPPAAFGVMLVGVHRQRRLRGDRGLARRRGAKRRALRRLHEDNGSRATATESAIADYVADRCNLPAGALTASEVIATLRSGGVDETLVADVESLLAECEQLRYAGGATSETNAIAERAETCLDRLDRERLR